MKIKWKNVFAVAILICLITLLLRLPEILEQLSFSLSFSRYFNDPMVALCFFGFVCLTIVCIAKIRSNR